VSVPKFLNPDLTPDVNYGQLWGMNLAMITDKDRVKQTSTTTGNSDGKVVSLFFSSSYPDDFICSKVFVINHNLKFGNGVGIYLEANLNGSPVTLTNIVREDVTNANGSRDSIFTFDQTTIDSMDLEIIETEPANQQKSVAEVIVTSDQISISREMTNYEYRFREKSRDINLGSGKYHRIIRAQANGKADRYEANCQFRYINQTELESLRTLYKTHSTFYFQPEPDTRPQDIFLCYMTNPWNVAYSSKDKNAGYTVNIQVKEV